MNEPSQDSYPRPSLYLVGGLLIMVGFAFSYWSTFTDLVSAWEDKPDYSHGYLVVPIAIWILWLRRARFPRTSIQPAVCWGLALVATSILMRYLGDRFYVQAVDGWSLVVWFAGVVLTLWGWRVLWWSFPSIVFLLFMIPLPYRLEIMFRQPLQDLAAKISCAALAMLGQPAIAVGNTIRIGDLRFGVEEACSGLRIFMGIAALAFVYVIAVKRSWVIRVLLILAMVPVTLIANSTRIVATCLLHLYVSGEVSYKFSHDVAGFVMIPFAAALFALFLWFLGFLTREDRVESKSRRSREKILVQPNLRRVVATLVVLAVMVPLAYGWHSYRKSRHAHVWLNLADESAAKEDWRSATNYLHQYLQIHADDAEVQIRLAETYDKSIDDLSTTQRAIELYDEALPLAPAEKVPVIRARIAELRLDLARAQPVTFAAEGAEAMKRLEANKADD